MAGSALGEGVDVLSTAVAKPLGWVPAALRSRWRQGLVRARLAEASMDTDVVANLQRGVSLENLNLLLPWQIERQELIALGKPILKSGSVHDELYWYNCTILGGITVARLRALLEPQAATPARWCFQGVSACLAVGGRQAIIDCTAQVAERLKQSLGDPSDEASVGGQFHWAKWQFGVVRVAVWSSEGDEAAPDEHSGFICCER